MRLGLRLLLLSALLCAGRSGRAELIDVPADKVSAPPRQDIGSGLCLTAIHLDRDGVLVNTSEALVRLDLAPGEAGINAKVSLPLPTVNLRNAVDGTSGDYAGLGTEERLMPFSNGDEAIPSGHDKNIATRVRGYLNITRAGLYTIGVHAEAGFRLVLADTLISRSGQSMSGRFTQQVRFAAAGLYRLELVHFVGAGPAGEKRKGILELALAQGGQEEVAGGRTPLPAAYQLLRPTDLYTALASRSDCRECTGDAACGAGSYCGDNRLCQPCLTAERCGPGCAPCAADRPICRLDGTCVACTEERDALCRQRGQVCRPDGTCGGCTDTFQCKGKVCRGDGTCGPCTEDRDCLPGQRCDVEAGGTCFLPECTEGSRSFCTQQQRVCNVQKGRCRGCTSDAECEEVDKTLQCAAAEGLCVRRRDLRYLGGCSAAAGGVPLCLLAPAVLLLLGLALRAGLRRARKGALAVVVLLGLAPPARAQLAVNAQTFRPALGPDNVLIVEGTRTPAALAPAANLVLDYAHRPLRLQDRDAGLVAANTVGAMVTGHVQLGLGVTRFFFAGASLPVVFFQTHDSNAPLFDPRSTTPAAAGVGDLRAVLKFRLLNNRDGGLGLAFVPQVVFPTGQGAEFRGEDTFGFEPRVALDYRLRQGTFIALNAGFHARLQDGVIADNRTTDPRSVLVISHQVRYGLGIFAPIFKGFGIGGDVSGATSIKAADDGTIYSPLEGAALARYTHRGGLTVSAGGGGAFISAPGVPQFRVFASIGYLPLERPFRRRPRPEAPPPADPDPDRDGLIAGADRCPGEAGPQDNDGCPDRDADQDGTVDRLDQCLNEVGPSDNGGCPDGDEDRDGVVDRLDRCPKEAGVASEGGCPEPDGDRDGIIDKADRCPQQAGPKDNGGCPDEDEDRDGVVDRLDRCPKQAGVRETQGCPLIEVGETTVKLTLPIKFASGAEAPEKGSAPVVAALGRLLADDPTIQKLRIGVPASGDKKAAKKLAGKRAKALLAQLVEAGGAKKRLLVKAAKRPEGDVITEATLKRAKVKAKKHKKPKE